MLLRWALQRGTDAVIPKSATPEHIIDNLNVFDFHLNDEDMAALSSFRCVASTIFTHRWSRDANVLTGTAERVQPADEGGARLVLPQQSGAVQAACRLVGRIAGRNSLHFPAAKPSDCCFRRPPGSVCCSLLKAAFARYAL